jgi:uncharacterized membrane protein
VKNSPRPPRRMVIASSAMNGRVGCSVGVRCLGVLVLGSILSFGPWVYADEAETPAKKGEKASTTADPAGPRPSPSEPHEKTQDPSVKIGIVGEGSFNSSADAQVRILIKNNDGDAILCIRDVEFFGPTRFRPLKSTVPHSESDYAFDCLDPGAQYPIVLPLNQTASTFGVWLLTYGYKEPIFAAIKYDLRARNPSQPVLRSGTVTAYDDYVYHTPTVGLIVGALAGWFLLAIVIFIRAARQNKVPWVSLLTAAFGSVILTLVLRYGGNITLPITVGVNDFYGALIVGLLSHRFSTPLVEWLGIGETVDAESTEKRAQSEAKPGDTQHAVSPAPTAEQG